MKWSELKHRKYRWLVSAAMLLVVTSILIRSLRSSESSQNQGFYSYLVDTKSDDIRFVLKNPEGHHFSNIGTWQEQLEKEGKQLVFAMNGGMYKPDGSPKGLFIEQGKIRTEVDLSGRGYGNFYMQPNGVLYLTSDHEAGICRTSQFKTKQGVYYATQSGPMLLIQGKINDNFFSGSTNKHIRNGVGLLKSGKLLFAMSKSKVNFHDFADFFRQQGCINALYLDGFVSRMYAPSEGVEQLNGDFGVIIGVLK